MSHTEKAGMRIEHWIKHSQSHLNEYQTFADELEQAGHRLSAEEIRAMATLTRKSMEHLHKAQAALKQF